MALMIWVMPAMAKEAPRLGAFDLTVSLQAAAGSDDVSSLERFYGDNDALSWGIYVPEDYDPANPPGIIVFISPLKDGSVPASWKSTLKDENMIYISAHGAGNRVPAARRMTNALLALNVVRAQYVTDPDITIISGFSGGARTSCLVLETFPGIFTGAMVMGGGFKWDGERLDLGETLKGGAYFFMAGDRDHAATETEETYRQYKRAGLTAGYRSIRNEGHVYPKRRDFAKAMAFLTTKLRDQNDETL